MKDDLDEEMNVENWAYNGTKTASGAVLSQGGTEKSETISFSFLILWSSQTRVTIAISPYKMAMAENGGILISAVTLI